MSYDHWKTTNPDDESLGNASQGDISVEEAKKLLYEKDAQIERLKIFLRYAVKVLEAYLPTASGGTRHPFIEDLRDATK